MTKSKKEVAIVGSGMGALTAAALLANSGAKVQIFEQNYLAGGCTSSYWRKGFIFESGATTLVGLDKHMPLHYLLGELGIDLKVRQLDLPMQVRLTDGQIVNRHQDLAEWIKEAERVFGKENQKEFWEYCYRISQLVWQVSTKQRNFPPTRPTDFINALRNFEFKQLRAIPLAFKSTQNLLEQFKLDRNERFVSFINEQLLITAQNHAKEVNALFGATALCYTNFGNYYVDGGLINLVNPLIDFIKSKGGELYLREGVEQISRVSGGYTIKTKGREFKVSHVLSGIPINNTAKLFGTVPKSKKIMESKKLWSAFQMGLGLKGAMKEASLHHQIILKEPLPQIGAKSFFVSLSHPEDRSRTDEANHRVMSVSTHIPNPENCLINNEEIEEAIIEQLEKHAFLSRDEIIYKHSSGPKSWNKWTGREFGFVGGYPQWMKIKPWQMNDARLDGKGAYICGDTTYPGQGIPGTVLSGIIAFEKMKADGLV